MLRDAIGEAGLSIFAEVGLVLFLVVFVLIAIRVLRGRRSELYEKAKQLPIEEEKVLIPRETHDRDRKEGD